MTNTNFPLEALPEPALLAAGYMSNAIQAPFSQIGGALLAAMALAVQDLADVDMGHAIRPLGLIIVNIAESGERKSTIQNLAFDPFLKADDAAIREFQEQSNGPHVGKNRKKPNLVRRIFNDATPTAMISSLAINNFSAALVSDEASAILNGSFTHRMASFNWLWDGQTIVRDRQATGTEVIIDPRVSIFLQIQNQKFSEYMDKKGDDARATGFFSRCLISCPTSTQGSRSPKECPPMYSMDLYYKRVNELINDATQRRANNLPRSIISFSQDAQTYFDDISQYIEMELNPGRLFENCRDFASKIPENLARVAAILQYFSGVNPTIISRENLKRAWQILKHYANEFIRLIAPSPFQHVAELAVILQEWFYESLRQDRVEWKVPKSTLLQTGPSALRKKSKLDPVLDYLQRHRRITLHAAGNSKSIILNEEYFSARLQNNPTLMFTSLINDNMLSIVDYEPFELRLFYPGYLSLAGQI